MRVKPGSSIRNNNIGKKKVNPILIKALVRKSKRK